MTKSQAFLAKLFQSTGGLWFCILIIRSNYSTQFQHAVLPGVGCINPLKVCRPCWRCGGGGGKVQQTHVNQHLNNAWLKRTCHIQTGSLEIMGRWEKPSPSPWQPRQMKREKESSGVRVHPTVHPYELKMQTHSSLLCLWRVQKPVFPQLYALSASLIQLLSIY